LQIDQYQRCRLRIKLKFHSASQNCFPEIDAQTSLID
jgi:hypothetical protein